MQDGRISGIVQQIQEKPKVEIGAHLLLSIISRLLL